ncbi:hypothetical protein [Streptomyces sp. NBC_00503]|uniref:hypothetical protein n=1 Tax=Streptomyces sp. NBC_00503 TaxID=2903659 RepID=UPI002E7FE002|nr:hypothetical protein [Streptomyces sp. NBC_00503]WUD82550.1 hypothetical protein OG490_19495 [Streptomyces sp. NBC_00503]
MSTRIDVPLDAPLDVPPSVPSDAPRLRPGARVRAVEDGLVLHRAGGTVRLRTAAGLPALWRAAGIELVSGAEPAQDGARRARSVLTGLLDEHGLLVRREVTPTAAQTAALATDDAWHDPASLHWQLSGTPQWTDAARTGLGGQADPARITAAAPEPGLVLRVTARDRADRPVAEAAVLAHGDGFAVVDGAGADTFARWTRGRGDAAAPQAPGPLSPALVAAVAVHRMLRALSGPALPHLWHSVTREGVQLRALPEPADLTPRTPRPLGTSPRTAPDDFGPVIDALSSDWDPELGPWREPHPGRLLQMPTAMTSCTLPATGPFPPGGRSVVGLGDTHDAAWVAAALGAARLAAAAVAPPGAHAVAGLGDLGLVADLAARSAVALAPPVAEAPEQWQPVEPLPEAARIRWAEGMAVLARSAPAAAPPRLGPVRLHRGGPLPVAEAELWLPHATEPVLHRAAGPDEDTAVAEALRLAAARTQLLAGGGDADAQLSDAQLSAEVVDPRATALAALAGDADLVARLEAGEPEAHRQALDRLTAAVPGTSVRQLLVGPRWQEAAVHVGWVGRS